MLDVLRSLFNGSDWSLFLKAGAWIVKKYSEGSVYVSEIVNKGKEMLASIGITENNAYEILTGNIALDGMRTANSELHERKINPTVYSFVEEARKDLVKSQQEHTFIKQMEPLMVQFPVYGLGSESEGVSPITPDTSLEYHGATPLGGGVQDEQVARPSEPTINRSVPDGDKLDRSIGGWIFWVLAFLVGLAVLERALPSNLQFLQPLYDRLGVFQSWFRELMDEFDHGKPVLLDRKDEREVVRGARVMLLENLLNLKGRKIGKYPASLVLLRLLKEVSEQDIMDHYKLLEKVQFAHENKSILRLMNV